MHFTTLVRHAPDEFRPGNHVPPLILTAQLHGAIQRLVQMVKIIPLQQGIGKFKVGKSVFQPLLHRFLGQHPVHRETAADIPQKIQQKQVFEPVIVVHKMGFAVFHGNETRQLTAQALGIFRHHLFGKHIAGSGPPGRVAGLCRGSTHQHHRDMTGFLQKTHGHHGEQVPHMQTVPGGVKANVKSHLAGIEIFLDRRAVSLLINKPARLQFLIDVHTSACFLLSR